ncbi:MAG: Asp23/Gls24 family envelope stress response protein [bacterium]
MQSNQTDAGNIKLSEEAIANISAIAAKSVDGVVDIDSGTVGTLAEALGIKLTRGIKVDMTNTTVSIDINLVLSFGCDITETGCAVQEKIREAVENMTGLIVGKINININSVRYKK